MARMFVMDLGVFAFCYTRECVMVNSLDRGAHRDPSYDVPVELFGPLAGQGVSDLFDVLVTSSREALFRVQGEGRQRCRGRATFALYGLP
jgi:hypothetical protein